MSQLRVPATSHATKVHNISLALKAFKVRSGSAVGGFLLVCVVFVCFFPALFKYLFSRVERVKLNLNNLGFAEGWSSF